MVSLYRSWSLVQQGTSRTEARDYSRSSSNNSHHNHHHHHHHRNGFSLFRSHTRTESRDSFAFSFGSQTRSEDLTSPSPLHVSQLSYSDQLEDYIVRYKRRPPDIKYWPYGPYWPRHFDGLLLNTPRHLWSAPREPELLAKDEFGRRLHAVSRTIDNQTTQFKGKWRGVQVAFDSERSSRDFSPLPVPEGCCPSLVFESRFECGNLRQARRVGQFEYELVLKPDLYTLRHTQWYYFRVTNAVPGVTYKLRIVNLLKRDSLYNHGMRPLLYSENDALEKQRGWVRTGHHICYSRNFTNHNCPLLQRGVTYHMLEWQMEFHNPDDTYYLAHCYPYSFTDLKEDLEVLMNSEERAQVTRRQVLCETRAGNSCFLITVTNFASKEEKKGIVISGRVHPGESQASWMMKGLLEFITGPDPEAQELRDKFIFKIVPMVNPDGVIVGNYRCSLAARDLNRNYRHPRRENFPVIWHIKNMVDELSKTCEIALYCDLHGHSRKPNVFMYGNNTSSEADSTPVGSARAFISERLFPWLMSLRSPEKFHFKSCKFQIRRCKESTGRVVMWRQLNVFNSFTLEATFSGTVLDRDSCRHFNILDFMEMGKILAQTVLDYHRAQDDHNTQTQAVLGLTQVITEQILISKGLLEPGTSLEGFGSTSTAPLEAADAAKVQESAEKWTGALLALLNTPREGAVTKDAAAPKGSGSQGNEEKTAAGGRGTSGSQARGHEAVARVETSQRPMFSREDVTQMLENLSGGHSMEDCLSFLSEIGVQDAIDESDSSDSDSESEPEMKPPEPKARKKKRKSKKHRDKDHEKKHSVGDKKGVEEVKLKALSNLPALSSTSRTGASNPSSAQSDNYVMGSSKQASSVSDKSRSNRQMGSFISKYEGRHNGGVPCFTEERSMERAAKRLAELRRKMDDTSNGRDLTFYCVDETGMHPTTNEEFNQRLKELGEDNPTLAATLLGLNVRTGYTHAEHLQDSSSSPNHGPGGVSPYLMSTLATHGYRPEQTDHLDHSFSDSCCDDDSDDYIDKNGTIKSSKLLSIRKAPTLTNGKENNKTTNNQIMNGTGSISIKSYRNHNTSDPSNKSIYRNRDINHYTGEAKEGERRTNTRHPGATSEGRHDITALESISSGALDELGLAGPSWGTHSLPVTARRNPYVQLEPLTDRSPSTLSLFKHSQGLSATTSAPVSLERSAVSQHLKLQSGEVRNNKYRSQLDSLPKAGLESRIMDNKNSDNTHKASSQSSGESRTSTSLHNLGHANHSYAPPQPKASSIPGTSVSSVKLGSLPSFSSSALSSLTRNGSDTSKSRSKSTESSGAKAAANSENSDVSRKHSKGVPFNTGGIFPSGDGSVAPPNIYTYFAVFSSVPGVGSSQPSTARKDPSTASSKLTNRNIWAGNHDNQSPEELFNVDRLVNSLSQNLSAVDPTSGSTIAKRHARYKTTHLRSLSRTGALSSSPHLGSGCLPSHSSRLVQLPDSLNSMTAASSPAAAATAGPNRVEDKSRAAAGRNSNLSLRGPSHTPNALHSPAYTWE
ncbi:hypothetical protein RRG08_007178 [Elysia crispata]|uniref:Peptidase M14 domain-containing protein n=1 Tax=Elysia crispata TaxID=231223 RepID=A0AAE1B4N2_9GAST|nr:hypothetical protein RRG08_007178 [Elysia crispata]